MQRFQAHFPAIPTSVGAIRRVVKDVARRCGLRGRALDDVVLAVSEAATNAVVHGSPSKHAHVQISVEIDAGELRVVVADEGEGIKPRPDSPGAGLGLPLIATLAKRFDLVSGAHGSEVHMAFSCRSGLPA